ncbi:MAG: N,N-dimethylformamidase beta subunit family domain-containing protein [Candidatus Limnocylindrales bacterium]
MHPPSTRTPRRRTLAGLAAVAIAIGALVGTVGVLTRTDQATPAGPPTFPPIPSFPSVAVLPPGATPGLAATIPLDRPVFPYVGDAPWQLHQLPGAGRVVEGFASRPSYLPGETLRLAVSTTASTYAVTIFRVSGTAPAENPFVEVIRLASQPGGRQGAPIVDPTTRMVRAPWTFTTSFAIPPDWPSGMYLARLESGENVQSYVPFVIRSRVATRFLLVSSALNWQAYNPWGGSDLYRTKVGQPMPGVNRALAVSFDRPYAADGGAGQLFFLELPMIAWVERQGLDVSFTTDYDLSVAPEAQPLPRAVLFNGHSEYWGVPLRLWLERHVLQTGDMGLGVFAADTGYWPVALIGTGADGPRTVICYKNGPLPGGPADGGPTVGGPTDGGTGASEPVAASPEGSNPPGIENEGAAGAAIASFPSNGPYLGPYVGRFQARSLFGVAYQHVTTAMAVYTLTDPVPEPALLAGTGIAPGSPLGFFAGGEVDATGGASGGSNGSNAPIVAGAYGIPSRGGVTSSAEAVYRVLPNGARIFASGTFYWGWALDPAFVAGHNVVSGFGLLTRNILELLAR